MNLKPKHTVIFFLLYLAIGCTSNQSQTNTTSTNYPIKPLVLLDTEEGAWGGDIRLSITNVSENDTANVYKAVSTYKDKDLGLLIFIPKAKESDKGFGKNIVLKSIGKESDNLLALLQVLYKQKISPSSKFIKSVTVQFVNLNEFAKSVAGSSGQDDKNTIDYKLFFSAKDDESELFFNINTDENWIELQEKDPEYRPGVIKALTL